MSNPRIEEVEDDEELDVASDPDEMDLDAFDFARPKGNLGGESPAGPSQQQQAMEEFLAKHTQPAQAQQTRPAPPQLSRQEAERLQREQQQRSKNFQCIYPVYFDSSRSREDGRRVKKEDAVANPLARDLVDALQEIGSRLNLALHVVFEPAKVHPKDWANPGRVRVLIKRDGEAVSPKIKNKHHLYKMISNYLKANPTNEESPLRLQIQGMRLPKDNKIPPPAVPRGFKMGTILPLHSPALSGGGVSDNMLKDMMDEMGGQLPPGMEGMAGLANVMGGGGGGSPAAGGSQKKIKVRAKR